MDIFYCVSFVLAAFFRMAAYCFLNVFLAFFCLVSCFISFILDLKRGYFLDQGEKDENEKVLGALAYKIDSKLDEVDMRLNRLGNEIETLRKGQQK